MSTLDPDQTVRYVSSIRKDEESGGPVFVVTADDRPDEPFVAMSSTGVWRIVVDACAARRGKSGPSSVSGPDAYGLSVPTIGTFLFNISQEKKRKIECVVRNIGNVLQELPGVDRCIRFTPQEYEVVEGESNLRGRRFGSTARKPSATTPTPSGRAERTRTGSPPDETPLDATASTVHGGDETGSQAPPEERQDGADGEATTKEETANLDQKETEMSKANATDENMAEDGQPPMPMENEDATEAAQEDLDITMDTIP